MNRTRAYYRYQRFNHIQRKKRIIHNQNDYWGYTYEGTLSKGKIHCSCNNCSAKYNRGQIKASDLRKLTKAEYDIKDTTL